MAAEKTHNNDNTPSRITALVKRGVTDLKKLTDPEERQKIQNAVVPVCRTYGDKTITVIDKSIHYIAGKDSGVSNEVLNNARGPIVFGIWVLIIVFGVFGTWAALAPIDSAAVARGTVVLNSSRKTLQHLEGGIIDEILVHEGDFVEAGQPLIRLNDTSAKARLDMIVSQLLTAKAMESRLIAERDSLDVITFDKEVLANQDNPDIRKIIEGQHQLFITRKANIEGQTNILKQRMAQLDDEIVGLQAQEDSAGNQLKLINEEISVVQKLLEKGNAQRPRLLALQRQGANLQGTKGQYQAQIAKAKQAITEAELQITNTQTRFINEVMDSLKETQVQIADLEERRRAAQDILDRIIIAAPQSGIVTDLQFHTKGGVITPGAKIMDLVPQDDQLVVEARVSLQDRDIIYENLKARIRLTAYPTRRIPIIEGVVTQISPDKFVDNMTHESYYKVRITIDEKELHNLKDVELQPGMPVDVLIVTGARSLVSYIMSPITNSFSRAFRED